MAHRRARTLRDKGDAERVTAIASYFILELWDDPRVRTAYETWHHTRAGAFFGLAVYTRDLDLDEADQDHLIARHLDRERETIRAFVANDLGLARWARWIAIALLRVFTDNDWMLRNPDAPRRQFEMRVRLKKRLKGRKPHAPPSKRPRHDGLDLARAASWYYQLNVQQPPATIPDLADAYVEHVRARGTHREKAGAHTVIQDGLDTVAWYLDLVEARAIELPPQKNDPATPTGSIH